MCIRFTVHILFCWRYTYPSFYVSLRRATERWGYLSAKYYSGRRPYTDMMPLYVRLAAPGRLSPW